MMTVIQFAGDILSSIKHSTTNDRRLLLRVMVKVMLWTSVAIGAWVIFSPLFKNKTPVNAKVVETSFDVTEMQSGEVELLEWFNKPLIIARRTQLQERSLETAEPATLSDPASIKSSQPGFEKNTLRSSTPGWFVTLGLGAGTGCAVEIIDEGATGNRGFLDPCDGSRYDLAGRVLAGQATKKNTTIPVWRYDNGNIIVSTARPEQSN